MNNSYKHFSDFLNSFISTPLYELITQQQQLYENWGIRIPNLSINSDALHAMGLLNSNLLNSGISARAEMFDSYQQMLAPLQNMINNSTNGLAQSLFPALQDPAALASYVQNIVPEGLLEDLNSFSGEQFKNAFDPFLKSINDIRINQNYVEFPETLIPEHLQQNGITVSSQQPAKTICISWEKAISILSLIITILSWIFPNPLSKTEIVNENIAAPLTQEQGEIIIDCLNKVCEHLDALTNPLPDEPIEPSQETVLLPPSTRPDTATPSSATQRNHGEFSTYDNIPPQKAVE